VFCGLVVGEKEFEDEAASSKKPAVRKKMPFGQSQAVVNSVNSDERGWEVGFKDRNMQAERLRDCWCRAV
jgi:hypothetical protein